MPEEDTKLEDLSTEDLASIIKELRKENAARRVKDNELKAKIEEYDKWKESQLSELEKAQKERDDAIAASNKALVDLYADKYKVPAERVKFLSGSTREEIEEAAKVLGSGDAASGVEEDEKNGTTTTPATGFDLFPGAAGRGTAVGSQGSSAASGEAVFDQTLRDRLRSA
ncbi:MAG TPA: hypothetical protein VLS45_07540 [Methylomicrobium sp.]|nr:hypothetical protein [Methylomicrobium sp.]